MSSAVVLRRVLSTLNRVKGMVLILKTLLVGHSFN